MNIVCASSVLFGKRAFSPLGTVRVLPDREIRREDLLETGALIVRSGTRVGEMLAAGTALRFAATATAGDDHVDRAALARLGIAAANAPGCNANSVAEAVLSVLAHSALEKGERLAGRTLGIVGCGNIGGRLARKAALLGMRVLRNDPPKARLDPDGGWVPLDRVLEESDAVTLHVPLTREGEFATAGMADARFFARMRKGAWFFNASRGGVADLAALAGALESGRLGAVWLDVWQDEPQLPEGFPSERVLFTPHIAGYSYEGRLEGTLACRRALCRFLGVADDGWRPSETEFPPPPPVVEPAGADAEETVLRTLAASSPLPVEDAARWRAAAEAAGGGEALKRAFDAFRKGYPVRREFAARRVRLPAGAEATRPVLEGLGFAVEAGA
jgi:erythronate-4-phosphate dehydrogenase